MRERLLVVPFFAPPLTPKIASKPNNFDLKLVFKLLYRALERTVLVLWSHRDFNSFGTFPIKGCEL